MDSGIFEIFVKIVGDLGVPVAGFIFLLALIWKGLPEAIKSFRAQTRTANIVSDAIPRIERSLDKIADDGEHHLQRIEDKLSAGFQRIEDKLPKRNGNGTEPPKVG